MPLRAYLLAIAIFCNEVKGKSMLALSRDLGTHYMKAFVLAHKMREATATEVRTQPIGGEGRKAEIDGGYFGGYVKPANRRENRRDRRLRQHQSGKRKVVVVIRERGPEGKTLPGVFPTEADALGFIRRNLAPQTTLYADEAPAWNDLHARYELHRINHQEVYSLPGGISDQRGGEFLLAHAARRDRPSSPRRWAVPDPVRARERLARRSPQRPERFAG